MSEAKEATFKPSKGIRFKSSTHHGTAQSASKTQRHRRHHRRHHQHSSHLPNCSPSSTTQDPELNAATAFRESLFDALADDEGAAYWEGVYGQPIHIYSRARAHNSNDPSEDKINYMTDEEYITHVRRKMWERSDEYIKLERVRRERDRERRRQQQRQRQPQAESTAYVSSSDDTNYTQSNRYSTSSKPNSGSGPRPAVDPRDPKLLLAKQYKRAWSKYTLFWNECGHKTPSTMLWPTISLSRTSVFMPLGQDGHAVEAGTYTIDTKAIEDFYVAYLDDAGNQTSGESMLAMLKRERVRWHPDKMMQRILQGSTGGTDDGVSDENLAGLVTGVFQVVDRMYGELR